MQDLLCGLAAVHDVGACPALDFHLAALRIGAPPNMALPQTGPQIPTAVSRRYTPRHQAFKPHARRPRRPQNRRLWPGAASGGAGAQVQPHRAEPVVPCARAALQLPRVRRRRGGRVVSGVCLRRAPWCALSWVLCCVLLPCACCALLCLLRVAALCLMRVAAPVACCCLVPSQGHIVQQQRRDACACAPPLRAAIHALLQRHTSA